VVCFSSTHRADAEQQVRPTNIHTRPMQVFLSYTRLKDQFGAVTAFHARFDNELKQIDPGAEVFFDKKNISEGQHFPEELVVALARADVLLPLLSPAWLKSEWCRREFELFTSERRDQAKLHSIVPVLWVATPQVSLQSADPVARALVPIQRADWKDLRHESWDNPENSRQVAALAAAVAKLVPPLAPVGSASSGRTLRLPHVMEQILRALDAADDVLTPLEVSQQVGVSKTAASVHLKDLQEVGLARPRLRGGQQETPWRISEGGQAYLVAHGLA
jgi:DNA-binding transcriptional ArsR family regulator